MDFNLWCNDDTNQTGFYTYNLDNWLKSICESKTHNYLDFKRIEHTKAQNVHSHTPPILDYYFTVNDIVQKQEKWNKSKLLLLQANKRWILMFMNWLQQKEAKKKLQTQTHT